MSVGERCCNVIQLVFSDLSSDDSGRFVAFVFNYGAVLFVEGVGDALGMGKIFSFEFDGLIIARSGVFAV